MEEISICDIFNSIYDKDLNIYDLCEKMGSTGYIDFITDKDLSNEIVKGIDVYNRKFIIFKANFIYPNNKKIYTLSTIFQRYTDCNTCFMCCGNHHKYLLYSDGGLRKCELELVNNLITNGFVDLTEEIMEKCRLTCDKYENMPIKIEICIK